MYNIWCERHEICIKRNNQIDGFREDSYVCGIPANGVPLAQGPYEARASAAFVVVGDIIMRVCVYIDGFNLYYRALKHSRHKWINLVEVAKRLLNPDDTVEMVRYFTARVSPRAGDPEAPRRQQILFSALATLPEIRFHYGKFLAKSKTRPLAGVKPLEFVEIMDTEEKGSDVNLAVHLLNDGWHKRYDAALVLSQDTDLVEPIRIVKEELGLVVGLVWLDGGNPSKYLRNASSFVRHLNPSDLAACQFTNPVMRPNGTAIHKPSSW